MDIKDPLIGREFKDYRLSEKLGGGAFGAVYRAEHTRLSKSFAVKVLHPHIATNEDIVTRFRREAQSLAGLDHPNIVQIVDFDQDEDIGFYLVLEWLKGEPLNNLLKREKVLPLEQVASLFSQLLAALGEAHAQGIVHRDLKPANLMILPSGHGQVLKVLDFGIAAIADGNHDLTTDGTAMGSANYMSPEQALGKIREIDNRSDLYSCGIIFGKCLTGKNIFPADSPTQILWKHIYEPAPRLNDLYPEGLFPEIVENIFTQAIAKDKADRFQSAQEFAQAIREAIMEVRQGMSAVAMVGASAEVTPRLTPAPAQATPTNGSSPAVTPAPTAAPTAGTPAAGTPAVGASTASPVSSVPAAPGAAPLPGGAGRAVAKVSPSAAARPAMDTNRQTPAGLPAHSARQPGRSSASLSSTGRFARFSAPRAVEGTGEGSASGGASLRQPSSTGSHSIHDIKTAAAAAVGESSGSISTSFGSNASQRSPVRPMIRGSRSERGSRGIRTARREPVGSSNSMSPLTLWLAVGGLVVVVVTAVWFFMLNSKPSHQSQQRGTAPRERTTGNSDDNFWRNLEKEANKSKAPGRRR